MRMRSSGGFVGEEALSRSKIYGSNGIMDSYSKIIGESGLDLQKEQEDAKRRVFKDFMEKAKRGEAQGSGKFGRVFSPTAQGFSEFLSANTAYQLDQGEGGAAWREKANKANWSRI